MKGVAWRGSDAKGRSLWSESRGEKRKKEREQKIGVWKQSLSRRDVFWKRANERELSVLEGCGRLRGMLGVASKASERRRHSVGFAERDALVKRRRNEWAIE